MHLNLNHANQKYETGFEDDYYCVVGLCVSHWQTNEIQNRAKCKRTLIKILEVSIWLLGIE